MLHGGDCDMRLIQLGFRRHRHVKAGTSLHLRLTTLCGLQLVQIYISFFRQWINDILCKEFYNWKKAVSYCMSAYTYSQTQRCRMKSYIVMSWKRMFCDVQSKTENWIFAIFILLYLIILLQSQDTRYLIRNLLIFLLLVICCVEGLWHSISVCGCPSFMIFCCPIHFRVLCWRRKITQHLQSFQSFLPRVAFPFILTSEISRSTTSFLSTCPVRYCVAEL